MSNTPLKCNLMGLQDVWDPALQMLNPLGSPDAPSAPSNTKWREVFKSLKALMIEKQTTRRKLNQEKKEKTRWQSDGCTQEGMSHYVVTQGTQTC